jgi:hypothetical protein
LRSEDDVRDVASQNRLVLASGPTSTLATKVASDAM